MDGDDNGRAASAIGRGAVGVPGFAAGRLGGAPAGAFAGRAAAATRRSCDVVFRLPECVAIAPIILCTTFVL
jgi:hypothetical protein